MTGYEEKLHLVERFLKTKEDVRRIRELSETADAEFVGESLAEIRRIADKILDEL